jgi:plastocyanin
LTLQIQPIASWRGRLRAALFAASLIAAPAAFAQSGDKPADAVKGHQYTVTINSMSFGATPSNLQVGDTISWANNDTVQHSVTARDHSFDLRLNPGQSAVLTLAKAGHIPFYCLFQPSMRGTLDVADAK